MLLLDFKQREKMARVPFLLAVVLLISPFQGATSAFAFAVDTPMRLFRPSSCSNACLARNGNQCVPLCYHFRDKSPSAFDAHINIIQRGGALRGATGATNTDSDKDPSPRQEALDAMRGCYRTTFLAVFVDALARLLPEVRGGWKIALASRPSSWLEAADAVTSINLIAFGVGLWGVTRSYEQIRSESENGGSSPEKNMAQIANIMRSYWYMYLFTGWSMIGLAMRLAYKVFANNAAPGAVLLVALGCSIYVDSNFASKEVESSSDKKSNFPDAIRTRKLGIEAAKNMGFCSLSFAIFGILRLVFWSTVVVPSELPVLVKVLTANKFIAPLALAGLTQKLDERFLDATVKVTGTEQIEGHDDVVFTSLKEAESGFYRKVATVLRNSLILDILRYGIPLVIGAIQKA